MPVRTTLIDLQLAMTMKSVHSQLDAYAIGLVVYEQSKYNKTQVNAKKLLEIEIKTLEKNCEAYDVYQAKLNTFDDQPDLSFYGLIALFNQLSNTYPQEAKQMMEALISFDTMGRYLLEERPIILDGTPFLLGEVLEQHGIDTIALKAAVRENRLQTKFLNEDTPSTPLTEEALPTPIFLGDSIQIAGMAYDVSPVRKRARTTNNCKLLQQKALSTPMDFELLSQLPTEKNINAVLHMMVNLFAHAQRQDSGKLDTLDMDFPSGTKVNRLSVVSLLQNSLHLWFLLSIVQATTLEHLTQRLLFMMGMLTKAYKKNLRLPAYASADFYLPLFTFAHIIYRSVLKDHPAVKQHWHTIEKMVTYYNAINMNKFTSTIRIPSEKKTVPLPPMRMVMTTHIALINAYADIAVEGHFEANCIERGHVILNYFRPAQGTSFRNLSPMTPQSYDLFAIQPGVLALFEHIGASVIFDFLLYSFPYHQLNDPIDKQLQVLDVASSASPPRIFYKNRALKLQSVEGDDALVYIERELNRLLIQIPTMEALGVGAITDAIQWSRVILDRLKQERLTANVLATPLPSADGPRRATGHSSHMFSLFGGCFGSRKAGDKVVEPSVFRTGWV